MRVAVDRGPCRDRAQCCVADPQVFGLDAGGRLVVLLDRPPEVARGAVPAAGQVCPMQAIRVEG